MNEKYNISKIPIIGFVVIEYRGKGVRFVIHHPLSIDDNGIGSIDIDSDETILAIIPSLPETYKVFGCECIEGSECKEIGIEINDKKYDVNGCSVNDWYLVMEEQIKMKKHSFKNNV